MAPIDNQLDALLSSPISPVVSKNISTDKDQLILNKSSKIMSDKSSNMNFDKTELTRLLLQTLNDLDYGDTAAQLIKESGITLNNETIERFLSLILKGEFNSSIALLADIKNMLIDENLIEYLTYIIKREFFLECLVIHNSPNPSSLNVTSDLNIINLGDEFLLDYLRNDLNDLLHSITQTQQDFVFNQDFEIHQLTSLIMNINNEEILSKLNFCPTDFNLSRKKLCDVIIVFVKPEFKLPNERLLVLLQQSIKHQQSNSIYHLNEPPMKYKQTSPQKQVSLLKDFVPDKSNFPIEHLHRLDNHEGEVWYGIFSNNGKYLATTSLDSKIIIYSVLDNFKVKRRFSCGNKAVSYCSWSPNDKYLLSCGIDTYVRVWDIENDKLINKFKLEAAIRCWSCGWLPNNKEFIVGSPDKNLKLYNIDGEELFDFFKSESILNSSANLGNNSTSPNLNGSTSTSFNLDPSSERVQDLTVTKDGTKLITINQDKKIHIWDIPTRTRTHVIPIGRRLTSIVSSDDSNYILINVSPEEVQLWDLRKNCLVKKFIGQQQLQFIIRGAFGNWDESVILSGSEDGKIYLWDRETCALIYVVEGHDGLANCVDWNRNGYKLGDAKYGKMWCSVGDDKIVNIWGIKDV